MAAKAAGYVDIPVSQVDEMLTLHINKTQLRIFWVIVARSPAWAEPYPLTVQDIAEGCELDAGQVGRELRRMVNRKIVLRDKGHRPLTCINPDLSEALPFEAYLVPPHLRCEVLERDHFKCVACGTKIDLTVDHIVPRAKGGKTVASNLQALCRPCNSRKGAR